MSNTGCEKCNESINGGVQNLMQMVLNCEHATDNKVEILDTIIREAKAKREWHE